MKKLMSRLLILAGLSAALATQLGALTINSPGVVGLHDGELANSNVDTERAAAQTLLDMLASMTVGNFETSDTEYFGTLVGGTQTSLSASGWEWGMAKYDGQNAGYVLFFLGGALASTIIPEYPADLWTTNPTQYQISHLTVWNSTSAVPDGGSTVALLGLALAAVGMIRRHSP